MSSASGEAGRGHVIARFSARLHAVLDSVADAPVWSMSPAEVRTVLEELAVAEARIAGLRLKVLAAGDEADIAAESGATSTAAWVAHTTRQPRAQAHADLRLARALQARCSVVREALAAGKVARERARVMVRGVDALPPAVPAEGRASAEKHLVGLAGE